MNTLRKVLKGIGAVLIAVWFVNFIIYGSEPSRRGLTSVLFLVVGSVLFILGILLTKEVQPPTS